MVITKEIQRQQAEVEEMRNGATTGSGPQVNSRAPSTGSGMGAQGNTVTYINEGEQ